MHLELFGTVSVTVLFLIAVGQWRHRTNHPGLASLYKLLQYRDYLIKYQVSRGKKLHGGSGRFHINVKLPKFQFQVQLHTCIVEHSQENKSKLEILARTVIGH